MSRELVAILDAPKSSGMGMHGVLLRGSAGLITAGLRANRQVSEREYDDLIEGGHVLPVEAELPFPLLGDRIQDAAVLWVGDDFSEHASDLHLDAPTQPRKGVVRTSCGRFWFDLPSAIFATTQHWLKNGLRLVVAEGYPDLARLMLNVDATNEFTRAALVHTSDDIERDLRWFVRLDSDAGLNSTPERMREHLDRLRDVAFHANGLVIALVAHFNRGSHDLGQLIASASGVEFCAFRDYFRVEANRLFHGEDRKSMVNAGEIVTDYRSPAAILECAVLGSLRPSVSGVPSAVVDGLRHRHILDALRKVPAVEVQLAAVTSPRQRTGSAIVESMPADEVERSNTESEVDELAVEAEFRLPRDRKQMTLALSKAS